MGLSTVTQTVLVTAAITAVSIFGGFLYKKWKKVKIPTVWERVGSVKKVHLYPLKSGHRIELQRAEVTRVGLRQTQEDEKAFQLRDRVLVVYGAKDFELRTARTYPKMVLIDVSVHDENHLAIDAPTMRTLYVKIPKREEQQKSFGIKSWYDEYIDALDCGDEAASWLSRYIIERDSGLRLGYHDLNKLRDISKTHQFMMDYYKLLGNASTGLYSDLSSITLINQHSVSDLNKKLPTPPVVVENFRQNVVVDGPNLQPYEEDQWDWIKIGDEVIVRNVKENTRCIFTTINPENGVRDPQREPLKTLETYRRSLGPEDSPALGINLEVARTGFIQVGDPVYIAKKEV